MNYLTAERKLVVFSAHCRPVGHAFEFYDFSDFQYGERLIRTTDGQSCALLTIKDEVVKEIRTILGDIYQGRIDEIEQAERFDRVFGLTCDPLENQELDASMGIVCPVCQTQDVDYHEAKPSQVKTFFIPVITHARWLNMTAPEKRNLIEAGLRTKQLI
ncbi:MAG: hypothetical protein QOE77_498 [Blastocatellia bacterium]|jgi:hypothetical protein|nr:hypothetical protein [Blastocatellia bacterium]